MTDSDHYVVYSNNRARILGNFSSTGFLRCTNDLIISFLFTPNLLMIMQYIKQQLIIKNNSNNFTDNFLSHCKTTYYFNSYFTVHCNVRIHLTKKYLILNEIGSLRMQHQCKGCDWEFEVVQAAMHYDSHLTNTKSHTGKCTTIDLLIVHALISEHLLS